jgi:hypothetical protein
MITYIPREDGDYINLEVKRNNKSYYTRVLKSALPTGTNKFYKALNNIARSIFNEAKFKDKELSTEIVAQLNQAHTVGNDDESVEDPITPPQEG